MVNPLYHYSRPQLHAATAPRFVYILPCSRDTGVGVRTRGCALGPQVQSASNSNQKEKYEGDLKKEIKKLQVGDLPHRLSTPPWSGGFLHLHFPPRNTAMNPAPLSLGVERRCISENVACRPQDAIHAN